MIAHDPLRNVELLAILEEATTPLRHDVRNRLASVRNLAFFVRRKLSGEVAPDRDPRVNDFLSKIETEVLRTDDVIETWSTRSQSTRPYESGRVPIAECLRVALDCARLPAAVGLELALPNEALEIEGDGDALAFAVRCLIENAGEAVGTGLVCISAQRANDSCRVIVTDSGPGIVDPARCLERFESSKPGHLGLGLCMARRIVTRLEGDLVVGAPTAGAEVSLILPLAGRAALP